MDVLSLRKDSGEVTGDIRINGHPQESKSFRRMTGYVEQVGDIQELHFKGSLWKSSEVNNLTLSLNPNYPHHTTQFDVQSPQLTIRETVEFSAKMRLDESISKETKLKFVDRVLKMLELDGIDGFLVGNDSGGLSFEQKKRLSIAVELASNPSVIFLDEPSEWNMYICSIV